MGGNSPQNLAYFLAPLGRVHATLHDESADVYRKLLELHEIDRFKDTPQLGIVSKAWEGTRHSRWDYIGLSLHLVGEVASNTQLKLTSSVSIPGDVTVSSRRELMQCWSLLSHLGHLHWTFFMERLLLAELNRTNSTPARAARKELLESVPDQETFDWANEVLVEQNAYRFHQLLGFHKLDRMALPNDTRRLWKKLLTAFAVERPSDAKALTESRRLFRRLRRIAFLVLDSEYSPTILALRTGRLLNDPFALRRLATSEVGSRADELSSLESYLTRNIYLGRRTLEETARYQGSAVGRIRHHLSEKGLSDLIALLEARGFTEGTKRNTNLRHVTRMEFDLRPFTLLAPGGELANVTDLEAGDFRWLRGQRVTTRSTVAVDAKREMLVHQVHGQNENPMDLAAAVASSLRFFERLPEPFGGVLFQRLIAAEPAEALLRQILHEFFSPELSWEFEPHEINVVFADRTTLETLDGDDSVMQGRHDRRSEVTATFGLAERLLPGRGLVALGNPTATGPDGRSRAELDGVIVWRDSSRRHVIVAILEVKTTTRSAEAAAKRDLQRKIDALDSRMATWRSRVFTKKAGGAASAWCIYRASYVNRV